MRANTFFGRIFLTLAALISVSLVAAALVGGFKLREIVEDDMAARRRIACDLLAVPAVDVLTGQGDRDAFVERLRVLGGLDGFRLTLIAADGSVMADSEVRGELANHGERPEVVAAKQNGRGEAKRLSTSTGKTTAYTTLKLESKGAYVGTLRAANEFDQVDIMVASMQASMLWFGVGSLIVGLLLSALVARWLSHPLKSIEREAAALSAGNLEGAVRMEGPLEVVQLGEALNAMTRELRGRLEGQRRARVQIETILASMAEGVVAVDRSERVLLMNRAAAELLGLDAQLESGALLWEKLRFPDLERSLRDALAGHGPWHGDAISPLGNGRTLGISVAPVAAGTPGDGADSQGAVALLADVTAFRRLEQVRIDFVANVSHELRTPLAAVMGALETLGDAEQDSTVRVRFLDIANRNAARLQAIVVDLLDLSSIEAQGDSMPLEAVRVESPLRTAASALVGSAESKGVKLEMPPPLAFPAIVNGNAQRLEQVFTNLLENALKYTPRGGRVRAVVRPGIREVSVDVEDTGVGIPESDLTRVFERFYRVDRSRSRDMGGTGLGLAIVKHVVRAHGGQVAVKSKEGVGSTFTVTLPLYGDPDKNTRS